MQSHSRNCCGGVGLFCWRIARQVRHMACPTGRLVVERHNSFPQFPAHGKSGLLGMASPWDASSPTPGRHGAALTTRIRRGWFIYLLVRSRLLVDLLPPIGHSRPTCSGPAYLVCVGSVGSCPKSQGASGAMGRVQRQQVALPALTIGSYCLRSVWCDVPYPRCVVLPRPFSCWRWQLVHRVVVVSARVGQVPLWPMHGLRRDIGGA